MSYETILYNLADGVARITLNRPESRNALNQVMYRELMAAFREAGRDKTVRAVVLTANGKGFCSGQDLVELETLRQQGISVGDGLRSGLNQLILQLRSLEKPIIGALNGVAAGAGASLALATDLRIASSEASFVFAAFVNIGIIPDGGGTFFLPHLIGPSKALELALLADAQNRVTAEQALALGIINQLHPAETFLEQAHTVAVKLASLPTKAIGMTKRAMYRALHVPLADALEYEAQVQEGAFRTHDFREGVAAFLEKRPPQFRGE
jgi:2-(1,2-epoxy-1,2-dihydrophenyl)acetyl-CoA isomerase